MNLKLRRWIYFLGWLLFSFYLSRQDGAGSAALSSRLANFLFDFVQRLILELNRTSFFRERPIELTMLEFHFILRKAAHFNIHLMLAFFCFLAVRTTANSFPIGFLIALVVSVGFAIVDEAVQLLADGRFATTEDGVLNVLGVLSGMPLGMIHYKITQKS